MKPELPKAISSFLETSDVYKEFSAEVEGAFGYHIITKIKEIDPSWKVVSWSQIDNDSVVAVIANDTCVDFYAFMRNGGPEEVPDPKDDENCYGLFKDDHYDGLITGIKVYRKEGTGLHNKLSSLSDLEHFAWWTIDGPEYIDQLRRLEQLTA